MEKYRITKNILGFSGGNVYAFLSFLITYGVFLIKYDIFFNGNGYFESASVLFHAAYFDSLWQGMHKLDNGYLPWLQMLLAYFIHGVLGAENNFFVVANLLGGFFISVSIAALNLKYFEVYIRSDLTRFVFSILVALGLVYSAAFGEFSFFHNFSQALLPAALLFYLALPAQKFPVKSIGLFLVAVFLIVLVNSKPYYIVFFPLGLLGLLFAFKVKNIKQAYWFYPVVMLAVSIQIFVMLHHEGSGLNNVTVVGYSMLDGVKDSVVYWLGTYVRYVFFPALQRFDSFSSFYEVGFALTILTLTAYLGYLWKTKQYGKIYLIVGLNLAALGGLFITLYAATGLLVFPRYVTSLDGYIPILNTRHFLLSNFAILVVLIMMLDSLIEILNLKGKSIVLDGLLRVFVVAMAMQTMLSTFSLSVQDNWFLYRNAKYISYHEPSDWKEEFEKFTSKDKPFLVVNGSAMSDSGKWGLSDFSRGVGWVNLLGTLSSPFSATKQAVHVLSPEGLSYKLLGAVGIPDPREGFLQASRSSQIWDAEQDVDMQGGIDGAQITARMDHGKVYVLHKNYMVWPGANYRFILTPESYLQHASSDGDSRYSLATGRALKFKTKISCDGDKTLRIYYQVPKYGYRLQFMSNSGVELVRDIGSLSLYDQIRNSYVLPSLQLIEGYKPSTASPIGWTDVNCSKLSNWNGAVEFDPIEKDRGTISVVTRTNGDLFSRLSDDIASVILYDKSGQVVGRGVQERDPVRPYKYFVLDNPVMGAEKMEFFNRMNEPEGTNIHMMWFGQWCPECKKKLDQDKAGAN